MKVTELNFFDETKTIFKFINGLEKNDFFSFNEYKDIETLKSKTDIVDLVNAKIDYHFELNELIYISGKYKNGSLSIYFFKKDTQEIIRVSDHWSKTNIKNSGVKECGSIKSCYWALKISNKDLDKVSRNLNIGVCKLSKFNNCDKQIEKIYWRELQNDWVDKDYKMITQDNIDQYDALSEIKEKDNKKETSQKSGQGGQ